VPAAFVDRLFDRFSKADSASGGAGLGLSIVARVMALHEGQARLLRTANGACFELDFSSAGEPTDAEVQAAGPRPGLGGLGSRWKSAAVKAWRKTGAAEVAG
jgi:hypothetical protein